MKSLLLKALAVGLLVLPASALWAQANAGNSDAKPVAVISLSGYQEVISDIGFIGKLSERPDLATGLEGMLGLFTQGKGLQGLDKKRPWGAVVEVRSENEFVPLVFVPVSNLKQLLGALSGVAGEARQEADGLYSLQAGPTRVFIKEQNGWAFVGQSADSLKTLPKNPVALLDGLDKSYDAAVRLHVQNIPEVFRDMALDQIKAGVESGLDANAGKDSEFDARKQLVEAQLAQFDRLFKETDQVTFGVSVDQKSKSAYADMTLTAVPESRMAIQFAQLKESTTAYGGFLLPDAAMTLALSTKIDPQSAKETAAQLDGMRKTLLNEIGKNGQLPEEARKPVTEAVDELFDVVQETILSGKMDAAGSVVLGDKRVTLVYGSYAADPQKVESALQKVVSAAKNEPDFPEVKFNAAKHAGVALHTVSIPVKDHDAKEVFGETLEVVLGTGNKSMYLAAGNDAMNRLKEAIDGSAGSAGKKVISSLARCTSLRAKSLRRSRA